MNRNRKLVLEDVKGFRTCFYPVFITGEGRPFFLRIRSHSPASVVPLGQRLKDPPKLHDGGLRDRGFAPSRDFPEKAVFFNSDLITFIAATDGTEDALGHSQFVTAYTLLLADALGIRNKKILNGLKRGALLHDIGKTGIPATILNKPGPLTVMEREVIKDHPLLGYRMIEEFGLIREAAEIVLSHHERFDGRGYPSGLAEDKIPLGARIFALADTLDAITSNRPYRKGRSIDEARREIERGKRSQFDPRIADIFLSIPKKNWIQAKLAVLNSLCLPTNQ